MEMEREREMFDRFVGTSSCLQCVKKKKERERENLLIDSSSERRRVYVLNEEKREQRESHTYRIPAARSCSVVCEPMYPHPPVTRT